MCGIAGIWNGGHGELGAAVAAMLSAMAHRGPDGRGTLTRTGVSAGMVRLALLDLSDRGQQPMWSVDGRVVILFNGEMYNFREERHRLEQGGYRFTSHTDTEVVLALYLERGEEFVRALRGMFALALLDWRRSHIDEPPKLLLARDALGIKPLYVASVAGGRGIVFASELRGLLASGLVPREVDRRGLVDYLSHGFVLQPRTMISGVRMVEPGTLERFVPGKGSANVRYWGLPPYEPRGESLGVAAERLQSIVRESVRLHAFADAPVGAFLSGGIDSSAIVALMREHVPRLHTYTIRFPETEGWDEADRAVKTAAVLDCMNTVVDVTGSDVVSVLPAFAATLDQPSTDGLNTWLVSRAAARDVKGVLSGLGGDEWFAGYPVTRRMARYASSMSGRAQAMAGHLAKAMTSALPEGRIREHADNLAARRSALDTWIHGHTVFRRRQAAQMAQLPDEEETAVRELERVLDVTSPSWRSETVVGLSCLLDHRVYMGSQLLRDSDTTSMAHSLELRVPLVDVEIAAFSRSCADVHKLAPDGGRSDSYDKSGSKRVLIEALRGVLPDGLERAPKRGFALPFDGWLRGELAGMVEDCCNPTRIAERGLLDPDAAGAVFEAWRSGNDAAPYPKIWSLVILELWSRALLDQPAPATSDGRAVALAS
jgi:asparagine synthase (glutamine-hydrolysing)